MEKVSKPTFDLEGKVALVTGAAGGIGQAVCELLGAAGAKLFLTGVKEEKLRGFSEKLTQRGLENAYHATELSTLEAPEELVRRATERFGALDILVNCAGINRPQKSEDVTEENWDAVMNINLKYLFFMCQAAGRRMIKQKSGCIINISSQAGEVALPLRAAYCSSKGGVNQLTRVLAMEWAQHNVRVNAVAPTFVETPFVAQMFKDESFKRYVLDSIPMGRMAEPEEVAYATLYLACDFSKIITGHILLVDGGWTIK